MCSFVFSLCLICKVLLLSMCKSYKPNASVCSFMFIYKYLDNIIINEVKIWKKYKINTKQTPKNDVTWLFNERINWPKKKSVMATLHLNLHSLWLSSSDSSPFGVFTIGLSLFSCRIFFSIFMETSSKV